MPDESAPPAPTPPARFELLNAARFVAAIYVVMMHYYSWKSGPAVFRAFMLRSPLAVTFFFVLSGFVLAYARCRGAVPREPRAFYAQRLARLLPAHALATTIMLVSGAMATPLQALAVYLMVQTWIPGWAHVVNFPAWSIAGEAFFYAALPLLFVRLDKRPLAWLAVIVVGCYAVRLATFQAFWAYAPLAILRRPDPTPPVFQLAAFLPLARLPEFVCGIILGLAYDRGWLTRAHPRAVGLALLAAAAALFAVLVAALPAKTDDTAVVRDLLVPCVGLPICLFGIYGTALAEPHLPRGLLRAAKPLAFLGEASFGIYILQAPLFLNLGPFLARHGVTTGLSHETEFWILTVALVVVATAVFQLVERPIQRFVKRRTRRPPAAPPLAPAPSQAA
jgi:peptidoglycan/LPS O-acetylase OafA/YrhL